MATNRSLGRCQLRRRSSGSSGDGSLPLQGAEASDGAHDGETRVGGDSNTLGDGAVVGADGAPVTIATRDGNLCRKAGAESRVGTERGEPEEGHHEVECQDSPDLVCPVA